MYQLFGGNFQFLPDKMPICTNNFNEGQAQVYRIFGEITIFIIAITDYNQRGAGTLPLYCPWKLPAGSQLATTTILPPGPVALAIPMLLVFLHITWVKCPVKQFGLHKQILLKIFVLTYSPEIRRLVDTKTVMPDFVVPRINSFAPVDADICSPLCVEIFPHTRSVRTMLKTPGSGEMICPILSVIYQLMNRITLLNMSKTIYKF